MPLPPIVMRRMTPKIVGTSMLAQGNVSSLANKKGHRQVAFRTIVICASGESTG